MVATIVLGFVHGWIRFGLTDWALYNRLIGLGFILCYLLTGALATATAGALGTKTLVRGFAVACATAVFAQWLAEFFLDADSMATFEWYAWEFSGLIGNRNAFATALVLALAVSVPNGGLWVGRSGRLIHALVLGLVGWGIYLSASRAGALALFALLIFLVSIPSCRRQLRLLLGGGIAVGIVFLLVDILADAILGRNVGTSLGAAVNEFKMLTDIQSDRIASLLGGLRMWLDHPVFGAGLGAFMNEHVGKTGAPLVIHNGFLWLLAEFGVIGFATFLAMPGLITIQILRTRRWRDDWANVAAMGCIITLGVMSLTHDVAYQRPYWLLVGAFIACPGLLTAVLKRGSQASA
jgi:O-antigen ligase